MRITKFGHSCVRVEYDGHVVVLDPGGWSQAEAVDGADAVLITHEHPDHLDAEKLRATDAPVYTIEAVASKIREDAPDVAERVTVVAPGDRLEVAGLPVRAVGELHAVIHPELPRFHNSGYVITAGDERLYHPGDALTPPGEDVDVLCAPVCAPWLKASEAIDFARLVGAKRNLGIHDRVYSREGLTVVKVHFDRFLGEAEQDFALIEDGSDL